MEAAPGAEPRADLCGAEPRADPLAAGAGASRDEEAPEVAAGFNGTALGGETEATASPGACSSSAGVLAAADLLRVVSDGARHMAVNAVAGSATLH